MQYVVLAAGKGTRMLPLTMTRSKPMIPVANRPFLEWVLGRLPSKDVVIIANKEQKDLLEYFDGYDFVFQEVPLGTGDAVRSAEEYVNGNFVVLQADDMFPEKDLKAVSKNRLSSTGFRVQDVSLFGSIQTDAGRLVSIEEKKRSGEGLANCGLYVLDERVFGYLKKIKKSPRGEYELTDAVNLLAKESEIRVHEASEWHTLSCLWNILDINKMLLKEKGPIISDTAEIRSGAVIEDPVAIGDKAIIGPNCFLREYSSIGANCKVGQAVEIKNSVIMKNTYVSHLSYVGDSVIGKNCNIAANTIFANLRLDEKSVKININGKRVDSGHRKLGGIVGDNVKFGTSCTIMPGKKIWPNLLIPPRTMVDDDIEKQPAVGYGKKG